MNILLVEDDAGLVELISEKLEESGFSVMRATSGKEALAHLKKQTPDMMLLDYSLPDINGKELIETLNKQQTPTPPFVITTGQGDERIAVNMMKLGAMDYVVKDILFLEKLPDVVKRVIKEIESDGKLKQAVEKLKESEEQYRSIYNNSLLGIFRSNPAGKILSANPAFLEIYNFKNLEEIYKTPAQDFYVNINDRNVIIEILKKEGIVKNHVTRERKRDNSEIYVKTNYKATKDEKGNVLFIDGVLEDITLQIEAEERLKESEDRFRKLIDNMPSGVAIYKAVDNANDFEFIEINKKAEEITKTSKKEIIGHTLLEAFPNMKNGPFIKGLQKISKDGINIYLPPFFYKDNQRQGWRENNIYKLASGEIVAIFKDVTDLKEAEEQLKKQNIELLKAKEKAEESNHLKSAFLANMSHEIRTPMNGILGFADLLKEPNLTGEKQQIYIGIIEKSGARMLNIINDIISISKIESGQMEVNIQESNINEQIEYIYTFFKPEIEAKGMQFSFKNSLPSKEAILKTDRENVYAILTNLVKNAIKYTPEGSIELGYILKKDTETVEVEFYVKDTGIGIPKDRQEAIFERFIQADIEDKMARQGAGLGLSISKAYVEILGGKIWVESEEGEGSTFYFTLPYTSEKMKEKNAKNEDLTPAEVTPVKKLKILIVEDDEVSAELISIVIQKSGKEIIGVRTGKEAVEVCLNNPDIDLVLMDILMPEMDGHEATRQIRKFNKGVIIIAQTAYAIEGDKEKALKAGCNDYITKPIKKDELLEKIEKYF